MLSLLDERRKVGFFLQSAAVQYNINLASDQHLTQFKMMSGEKKPLFFWTASIYPRSVRTLFPSSNWTFTHYQGSRTWNYLPAPSAVTLEKVYHDRQLYKCVPTLMTPQSCSHSYIDSSVFIHNLKDFLVVKSLGFLLKLEFTDTASREL